MKNSILYLLVAGLLVAASSCQQGGTQNVKLETQIDSVSYAIGVYMGSMNNKQLKNAPMGDKMNLEAVASGFSSTTLGEEAKITEDDANQIIQKFFAEASDREAQENLEAGNKFLEENGKRDGVVTTESGLQYEILKEGDGEKPTATDKVRVHYHGTLIDGTVFESTVEKGQPVVFGVNQVIAGWTEALQLMPVGSKWKVYIPADLAYGANPRPGGAIKPNMALIFELELLEIVKDGK